MDLSEYWSLPPQEQAKQQARVTQKHENPCIMLYGPGPITKQCGQCTRLYRYGHHDKTYLKCALRKLTNGKGSDHRAKWQACAKFVQKGK